MEKRIKIIINILLVVILFILLFLLFIVPKSNEYYYEKAISEENPDYCDKIIKFTSQEKEKYSDCFYKSIEKNIIQ